MKFTFKWKHLQTFLSLISAVAQVNETFHNFTPSRRILAISKSDMMKCNQIVLVLFAILMETARGGDAEVKAQLQLFEKTIVQVGSKIIDLERKNEELEKKVSHQSSENVEFYVWEHQP